jgi:hypothetical protein
MKYSMRCTEVEQHMFVNFTAVETRRFLTCRPECYVLDITIAILYIIYRSVFYLKHTF